MVNTVYRLSPACWHRGPRGVAPERMPKADATELAPKKIGCTPPAWRCCAGGPFVSPQLFAFLSQNRPCSPEEHLIKNPFSLVRLPSGGLGLQNAKIARLLLP